MTGSFTLQPTTPDDMEGLRAALDAVARERRYLTLLRAGTLDETRSFVESLLRGGGVHIVARAEGRVVGWCDVLRHHREGTRHGGVLGIGLLPEWRERGVGAALLARTLEAAEAAGMTRVELEVFASNTRAIRLYEGAGFVHEGLKRRARCIDGRVEDIVCMARLTEPASTRAPN